MSRVTAGRRISGGVVLALSVGLLLLLRADPRPAEAQAPADTAVLVRVTGRVEVQRQGESTWTPTSVGARLKEGDELRAQPGAFAELRLPDASTLLVSENSRIVLSRLQFDPKTRARESSYVHLVVGKVRAVLSSAALTLIRARQSNFAISTPAAVAAARGTDWVSYFHPGGTPDTPSSMLQIGVASGEVVCLTLGSFQVGMLYAGDIFQVVGSAGCVRATGVNANALFGLGNPGTANHNAMDGPSLFTPPAILDGVLGQPFTRLNTPQFSLFTPQSPRPEGLSASQSVP